MISIKFLNKSLSPADFWINLDCVIRDRSGFDD